jgi:ribonucleotide monophosphatase NagD (HAD superfamily)
MIIFDWKQTLYDPETKTLIQGAEEIFMFIKDHGIEAVIIGKGGEEMYAEVDRLGITHYFADIIFDEEKDEEQFIPFVAMSEAKNTHVVGDRVKTEIAIGNRLGATTVWVKQGPFATEEPEKDEEKPTHIVSSLQELHQLFQQLFNL